MIAKKNRKADLEKKRFAFFQIGLIVSGSLCLAAFEYASVEDNNQMASIQLEDELVLSEVDLYDFDEVQKKQKQVVARQEVINEITTTKTKLADGVVTKTKTAKIVIDDGDDGEPTFKIIDETDILPVSEVDPEFIGGLEAMSKFISSSVVYPELEAEMGIGGVSYIQFVVNTDGSICQVKEVSEEEDLSKALSAEAIRVVKSMPKWKPGEQAGKKVRVRYTIPIRFIAPR